MEETLKNNGLEKTIKTKCLTEAMDKHVDRLKKIEAVMNVVFGDSYLKEEFESTREQEQAILWTVSGVLQGIHDSSMGSKKDETKGETT